MIPRRTLPALMLTLAAAPLWSTITLRVTNLPAHSLEGAPLEILVRAEGAGPGREIQAAFIHGGRTLEGRAVTNDAEEASFALPTPPFDQGETLTVVASTPGGVSSTRSLRIVSRLGGLKRARTAPAETVPGEAAAPVRLRLPSRFGTLPNALFIQILQWANSPGSLPGVCRAFRDFPVTAYTYQVSLQGPLTDTEAVRRIAPMARLVVLDVQAPQGMTSTGLRSALANTRRLLHLRVQEGPWHGSDLAAVAAANPFLVTFHAPGQTLAAEAAESLPLSLEEAAMAYGDTRDADLKALTRLRKLSLGPCPGFTGKGLPPSLVDLEVKSARDFAPTGLPVTLRRLVVSSAPKFQILPGLPDLECLTLEACPGIEPDALAKLLEGATRLVDLRLSMPVTPATLDVAGNRLVRLHLENASQIPDTALARFLSLQELYLKGSEHLTGEHLPATLHALCLRDCPNFRPENLARLTALRSLALADVDSEPGWVFPASLVKLQLTWCDKVSLDRVPPGLAELKIENCESYTRSEDVVRVAAGLGGLRRLAIACPDWWDKLEGDGLEQEDLQMLEKLRQEHPSLEEVWIGDSAFFYLSLDEMLEEEGDGAPGEAPLPPSDLAVERK